MLKRSFGVVLTFAMMTTACGSRGSDQRPAGSSQDALPSITSSPAPAIEATWRRNYTCGDLVRAFKGAGVGELAPNALVGLHMVEGSAGGRANPCKGAAEIELTHVFKPNGYLLSYRGSGLTDDCRCYTLIGSDTFVSLGDPGDPDISLHYVIDGDTLTFDVVVPDPCSAKCQDQVAFTVAIYAVGPWERVS